MNIDPKIVCGWIVNLNGHADALILSGLVVRTGDIVVKFLDRLEMLLLVERNCQGCRRSKLYLSKANIIISIRVCQVRLGSNDAD